MGRFHLDHNVSRRIAELLRNAGHDVVTARELGLEEADDDVHLLAALRDDRVFVTHNGHDFILLHYAWRRWTRFWQVAQPHAGILVVPQVPHLGPVEAARELDRLQRRAPLADELYQYDWQATRDWLRSPPP